MTAPTHAAADYLILAVLAAGLVAGFPWWLRARRAGR